MCSLTCSPDDWLYPVRGNIGASFFEPLAQPGFANLSARQACGSKNLLPPGDAQQPDLREPLRIRRALLARFRDDPDGKPADQAGHEPRAHRAGYLLTGEEPITCCNGTTATWQKPAHVTCMILRSGIASPLRLITLFDGTIRVAFLEDFRNASRGKYPTIHRHKSGALCRSEQLERDVRLPGCWMRIFWLCVCATGAREQQERPDY